MCARKLGSDVIIGANDSGRRLLTFVRRPSRRIGLECYVRHAGRDSRTRLIHTLGPCVCDCRVGSAALTESWINKLEYRLSQNACVPCLFRPPVYLYFVFHHKPDTHHLAIANQTIIVSSKTGIHASNLENRNMSKQSSQKPNSSKAGVSKRRRLTTYVIRLFASFLTEL
jgi:hypothetical protein